MITISIGDAGRALKDASPDWVNEQINRRRANSVPVCVRVRVQCRNIDVLLSTPGCGQSPGGSRRANREEERVLQLWEKRGLNRPEFTGGNLVAFLKRLESLVGSC